MITSRFTEIYGYAPAGVWSAPGRVNLIGEHTDYNEGFVLPFAIGARTSVAAARRDEPVLAVASAQYPGQVTVPLAEARPGAVTGWPAYPVGVAWALAQATARPLSGVSLYVDSEVPAGSGLSSSAALECAVGGALNDLWSLSASGPEIARACRRAENEVVGAPTGIMDQFASLFGEPGAAVFLDCRTEHAENVPLDLDDAGLEILLADTGERHSHGAGGYASRRASCERAARILGVRALRDIGAGDLEKAAGLLDDETFRRVRHVVTEDERVLQTVRLLRSGVLKSDPGAIGALLSASHESMRDDFAITTPALDLAVATALDAGALGARMTGGGFGGAIIALAARDRGARVADAITRAFARADFAAPALSTVAPSAGARREG
ncbi:MAG TPA: galactokinase [Trebonia sp.]|nr:galactokinase [Trebonia sp.]